MSKKTSQRKPSQTTPATKSKQALQKARQEAKTAEELRLQEAKIMALRYRMAYFPLVLLIIDAICAIVVVFLVGFGYMDLPNNVIIALLLQTIAAAAAILMTVTRSLFPTK